MFPEITGCWLVLLIHSSGVSPMLHDVVPTEYERLPLTGPLLV